MQGRAGVPAATTLLVDLRIIMRGILASMVDHERAMLAYVRLADVSQRKHQLLGRDKLLILAAGAACRAGWLDVAARCRQLVLMNNPAHLIGSFATVADALRSDDFGPFLKQLERQCGYERAEFLANDLGLQPHESTEGGAMTAGQVALSILEASSRSS